MKNLNNINMNITQSYQPVLWSRCYRTLEPLFPNCGSCASAQWKGAFQ